ncbi:MAG: hypothetical protein H7288_07615 [Kineosporiaceae bacterium]|nr:hypothetical protein [Aeromicrobium sp.]
MPRPPKPGGAVFEPRSYTDNRKKFGLTSSRLTTGPITSPQQAAAELQHSLSNKIREHLIDIGGDMKSFCAARELPLGLSYERFYRIANGSTMMALTDLMFWTRVIPHFSDHITATMLRLQDSEKDLASEDDIPQTTVLDRQGSVLPDEK